MFEPRPEIRIAIRLRLAMMCRGPGLAGAPGLRAAAHGTSRLACLNMADTEHRFAGSLEPFDDLGGFVLANDRHHPDAAVERAGELRGFDRTAGLEKCKQAREGPAVGIDHSVSSIWKDPWNI